MDKTELRSSGMHTQIVKMIETMIPKSQMVVTSGGAGGGEGGSDGDMGGDCLECCSPLVPCLVAVHVLACMFLCVIYLLQLKKKNMAEN